MSTIWTGGSCLAPGTALTESESVDIKAKLRQNTEDALARDVAHLMYSKNIKRVPVLRDGKLVGIVARSDLVRALAEKLSEPTSAAASPKTVDEALRHGRTGAKS